jgi:uncharacterized OB-fold protein
MAHEPAPYEIDEEGVFRSTLVLSYPYSRTVGAHIGRFLTGLRDGRIEGVRLADGRVLVPPPEIDPLTGESSDDWVPVAPEGVVETWTWIDEPLEGQPLSRPFAYALIRLDGTASGFLHAVDAGSPDAVATGTRVRVRWRDERVGSVTDIECFEVIPGEPASGAARPAAQQQEGRT